MVEGKYIQGCDFKFDLSPDNNQKEWWDSEQNKKEEGLTDIKITEFWARYPGHSILFNPNYKETEEW